MRTWIAAHRGLSVVVVVVVLAVGGWLFFYYFGFQNAVIDREVNEALPTVAAPANPDPAADPDAAGGEEAAPAAPVKPVTLSKGRFQDIEHHTTGAAAVIELANGDTILRLEDLDTLNGPDLKVYLSESPAAADPSTFDDRYVSLGDLKGNKGDQNYDIPRSANLNKLRSAVIWCERFSVGFGVAPLERV